MPSSLQSTVSLSSGYKMPVLGFGVWAADDTVNSVSLALRNNYRHIDTARHYKNEKQVGDAVCNSGIPRENLFLTSKVWYTDHGLDVTAKAVDESLEKIGGGYWDLYLLHSAKSGKEKRIEAWRALEQAQKDEKIRTIGVSNFNPTHIDQLLEASLPMPAVNQIELHPFCQQKNIVEYCKKNSIVIQAFCPIARARYFDHPVIMAVSESSKRTPAQVMIRWNVQKGYIPITKSDKEKRIIENSDVYSFELTSEEMEKLDILDKGAAGAVSPNPVDTP